MKFASISTVRISTVLGVSALLAACNAQESDAGLVEEEAKPPVIVDLRVRENADSAYVSTTEFTVPASHEIGDGMMPYEGIGWENGLVGYRLYLDGRLVSDIFGKQVADPALAGIAEFGSYHDLAPWGMDVLKVGPSLGIGGLGIMRDDQPEQFGSVPELSATISESGGETGGFTITAGGIEQLSGSLGGFTADYTLENDSPLTRVKVKTKGDVPLATGIVMHDGAELLQSDGTGDWQYVATWGDAQSENKDGLGMALFYRAGQASYGGLANSTHYVAFNQPEFEYGFLAVWELDLSSVTTQAEFEALLNKELSALAGASQ